jgi:UDP-N-acetylmuramoyl-L-alanyl-D-glutamate--2,6-diaminopimelate ligase
MIDSMMISALIQNLAGCLLKGSPDTAVTGLHYDSRTVEPGSAFFALRGQALDGHHFIDQALERGAKTIFLEKERDLPPGVAAVVVDDCRRAMAQVAAVYFGDPTADIPVVGVTGTNGKTTVTYLVEAILRAAGYRPAVFGTINYRFADQILPSLHTTPEAIDMLRGVSGFRRQGADALVMEVSSHALEQHRVGGVHFKVGVFTNLTPEHLDYHGNMEDYFASKARLFTELLQGEGAVINIEDPYGKRLASLLSDPLTCGRSAGCAISPLEVRTTLEGISGTVATPDGTVELHSPLLGDFNLQNLLCAIGAGVALGLSAEVIGRGLSAAPQVPGRLERVDNGRGVMALVDYAHTGDALDKVLVTLAALAPRRMITVFGCGGDRDRSKRPVMGEIAARRSDLCVVTSDNPRTEDPAAIIAEVCAGVAQVHRRPLSREEAASGEKGYLVIPDRREAIAFAAGVSRGGDLLLVAGKGHEDYQIVGRERFHFDDREELNRAMARQETTS